MTLSPPLKTNRIDLVDALRGMALLAIVLLHNLEHYNIFGTASREPEWLQRCDSFVTSFIYFIFAGKAYATFSLLFGLSFYIQMRNARARGCDFRARFAWRMLLLAGFAQLHALFYNGDILLLYAVCGLILIPASQWSDKKVLIVATVLMLQPYAWSKIIYALFNPGYVDTNSLFVQFAASAEEVGRNGNFLETLANNIGNGQLYSNFWQVEAGRLFQTPALFLLGMWLGRKQMFTFSANALLFWKKALGISLVAAIPLYALATFVPPHISNITILSYYGIAVPMVFNFALMTALISAFTLIWFKKNNGGCKWQSVLAPYGRMSLTNYITQSIIGVTVYYNYGLAMYDRVGATGSLLIGFAIFGVQLAFSRYWLSRHRQGPLEYLWKKATWLNFSQTQTQPS